MDTVMNSSTERYCMKTYLFDLDGTLIDSVPVYVQAVTRILDDYHIDYPSNIGEIITPLGSHGTAELFIKMGIPLSYDELIALFGRTLLDEYVYRIPEKKNVTKVLKSLKARGNSLNILTASPHTVLDPCVKRLGFVEYFDNIWSADDFNMYKSDPQIYREAAKKLNVAIEDIIFIDDNAVALKAAKQAGAQVYGAFEASARDQEETIRANADRYIMDFIELLD